MKNLQFPFIMVIYKVLIIKFIFSNRMISRIAPFALLAISNVKAGDYYTCNDCEARFAQYQIDFTRSYATEEEEAMRYYYFKRSVRYIDYYNARASGDDDLRLGLNEFSDWSTYEFRDLLRADQFLDESSESGSGWGSGSGSGSGSSRRRLEDGEDDDSQGTNEDGDGEDENV